MKKKDISKLMSELAKKGIKKRKADGSLEKHMRNMTEKSLIARRNK